MIKEAIDRILELQQPPTFEDSEGIERNTSSHQEIRPPKESTLSCSSLESAVDVAKSLTGSVIIECGLDGVDVRERRFFNGFSTNRLLCVCRPVLPDPFLFGRPFDIENFIAHASDFFERDENLRSLIASVSLIVDINEAITEDDGFSQAIIVRNRLSRKDSGVTNPFVTLRAFRTFREVEQPEATYLLRIGKSSNGPTVTLHEASGYEWKVTATESVFNYVKERVGDAVAVIR